MFGSCQIFYSARQIRLSIELAPYFGPGGCSPGALMIKGGLHGPPFIIREKPLLPIAGHRLRAAKIGSLDQAPSPTGLDRSRSDNRLGALEPRAEILPLGCDEGGTSAPENMGGS